MPRTYLARLKHYIPELYLITVCKLLRNEIFMTNIVTEIGIVLEASIATDVCNLKCTGMFVHSSYNEEVYY